MAPNPRVLQAFRAMRNLGIPEEKVKPVLKNLLKLYEKKWELIEEENYRALADAIFEAEETEVHSFSPLFLVFYIYVYIYMLFNFVSYSRLKKIRRNLRILK